MVCKTVIVPDDGSGGGGSTGDPRASLKRIEVASGQLILFLRFEQAGTGEVPYTVDIFDNGTINRNESKSFDIGAAGEERTLVITDLPKEGASVKVCIHPNSNPDCETAYVEGNKDFGGGDEPDDGDGSDEPQDSPSIGPPEITNVQTITNLAQITYSLTNTGTVTGEKTVRGTIDLGATGQIDAEKIETVTVNPQDTAYQAFDFETDLTGDTEAIICVKEL